MNLYQLQYFVLSDRKNFKIKRNQQIAAVKSILQLNNYAKQFDVVDKVTEKMFWVTLYMSIKLI